MTDTSKREELIKEAAKAIQEARWVAVRNSDGSVSSHEADSETLARAAFAVFEQAHTPAEDEREALARLFDEHWMTTLGKCACGWVHPQYGSRSLDPYYVRLHLADVVTATGFRRTAVQEPQIECPHWSPGRITIRKSCTACAAESEPQGEPKHDASCGERCNHCQVCGTGIMYGSRCPDHYLKQPQSEPTDAQVDAGCVAFHEHATGLTSWGGLTSWARLVEYDKVLANRYRDGMRRALRAAYETKGEGR
jgi:hypothetical protein